MPREDNMDRDKVRAFADKVYADSAGAMAAGMAYVGTKMGLFRSMAGKGPLRIEEVATASGLQPRYVEEWLKGMASAGYLDYQPEAQTFALPEEHAYLLASEGSTISWAAYSSSPRCCSASHPRLPRPSRTAAA